MAKKKSQLERAIDALEAEQHVLQLAIDRLRQQQASVAVRRPRKTPERAKLQTVAEG